MKENDILRTENPIPVSCNHTNQTVGSPKSLSHAANTIKEAPDVFDGEESTTFIKNKKKPKIRLRKSKKIFRLGISKYLKNIGKSNSTRKAKTMNFTDLPSSEMEPIPPELLFLLDQPEVAIDITDNFTEFEFTVDEILSGGEEASMIILPNPAFSAEQQNIIEA